MDIGYAVLTLNFIYIAILAVIFFTRKKVKNVETTIFGLLIISNLLGLVLEFLCGYFIKGLPKYEIITFIINKLHIVNISFWITTFTLYVVFICFGYEKIKKKFKNLLSYIYCYFVFIFLLAYVLPINYFNDGKSIYSYGPASNLIVILCIIYLAIDILAIIKNIRNISKLKLIPLIILIIGLIVVFILRSINPSMVLITTIFSFVTTIMYHTIENPDIKMVRQLEIANIKVEKASRAKSEFLSSMSHEIRTPLNAIVGFSSLIKEANTLEEAKENAEDIVSSSEKLLTMISNVLDIARIDTNKSELKNVNYNFNQELNKVIYLFISKADEKGIILQDEIEELPKTLNGDVESIKRIVANLLDNAIKYTEKGSINLIVKKKIEKDNCKITITISDTGVGISKKVLKNIFEEFNREEKYRDTATSGMGLGLSISKKLLDMMGGKIEYKSSVGKGTTFTIYLTQKIVEE